MRERGMSRHPCGRGGKHTPRAVFTKGLRLCVAAIFMVAGSHLSSPPALGDDPAGLADNDFGNNGESSVPNSAYEPGKKERDSKEYKKENPDNLKRDYYEKGGKTSNHDGACRAKTAYKAARYEGPKNGYDGTTPKAGGGKYADNMPADPGTIVNNVYKFVEDITYPKGQPNPYTDDAAICGLVDGGTIDIGKGHPTDKFMCIETAHFFASLLRELGFPVREKNVLPSFADGTYDVQTAAVNVWYGGKWHFFDPWESFTDSEDYLKKTGHAGYGPYHDADVYVRESAPQMCDDYGFNRHGTTTRTGWKKIKSHKMNGTKIETQTYTMRIGVQDHLGRVTGGATGTPLTDIPASIYVPYDRPVQLTHADEPAGETYGIELVTLLYADMEPPGVHNYRLLIHNPTGSTAHAEVDLEAMPVTVEIEVEPPRVFADVASGSTDTLVFQVTIGSPVLVAPDPIGDLHVSAHVGDRFTLSWSDVTGATEYRVFASPIMFDDPSAPGVQLLGTATSTTFDASVTEGFVLGVEAVGPTGLVSGLDPDGGSTTTASPTSIPTLSEWGAIIFGTLLLAGVVFYIWRRRRTAVA